jgi:hypothetical protein
MLHSNNHNMKYSRLKCANKMQYSSQLTLSAQFICINKPFIEIILLYAGLLKLPIKIKRWEIC